MLSQVYTKAHTLGSWRFMAVSSRNFLNVSLRSDALGGTLLMTRTYNKLTQVSTMFTGLVRLKILDLSGNPIKSVPSHLGKCEDLEELYVNFCSLLTMDIHLAECRKVSSRGCIAGACVL